MSLSSSQHLLGRHKEVQDWLDQIFVDEPCPQFEINDRTLEILLDLKRKNEERDREAQVIKADVEEKTNEYHAEAARISSILDTIGFSSSNLSQSGNVSLRALSSSALTLGIKHASTPNYVIAIGALGKDLLDVEEARKLERREHLQLFNTTKKVMLKAESLKQNLEEMEHEAETLGPDLEKKMRQSGFLHNKSKEYVQQLQQSEGTLEENGMEPSLYHQNLEKLAKSIEDLDAQIAPIKSQLDSYHNLPPNQSLAKVKIEEVRRELAALESELSRRIDLVHM